MKKLGIIFGMTFLLSLSSFSVVDATEKCVTDVIKGCGYVMICASSEMEYVENSREAEKVCQDYENNVIR